MLSMLCLASKLVLNLEDAAYIAFWKTKTRHGSSLLNRAVHKRTCKEVIKHVMCFLNFGSAPFSTEVFQGLTSPCSSKSRRCGAVHLSQVDLCLLSFEATGYVYVRPFARLFLEVAARLFEAKGVATPHGSSKLHVMDLECSMAQRWPRAFQKRFRNDKSQMRKEQNGTEMRKEVSHGKICCSWSVAHLVQSRTTMLSYVIRYPCSNVKI